MEHVRTAHNIRRFLLGVVLALSCGAVTSLAMAENDFQRFAGRWLRADGGYVLELRDANYPGSFYNLRYDPKNDRLMGTYFQAVQRETYDIEFVRIK
jgi:hypothetical protein